MSFFMSPEEIQEHNEQHRMSAEEFRHSIRSMVNEMSEDHLSTLLRLFNFIGSVPVEDVRAVVSYHEGVMSRAMDDRFKRCTGCGANHDLLPECFAEEDKPKSDVELMELYNVTPTGHEGAVQCKNCGATFVSLGDRMRRSPGSEGCAGCIEKEKWG